MTRIQGWLGLLALAAPLACTDTVPKDSVDLGDCAGDADQEDVTYIAWEFDDSAHEMITCGGLTFQLLYALIETAQTILTDPEGVPSAFSYADGVYTTQGTGMSMELVFRYSSSSPVGTKGEIVEHNLFDPDSYLVGAVATDNGDGTVTVAFDSQGPLAPMLGLGEDLISPLILTGTEAAALAANFGSLKVEGSIFVDDERTKSLITYELKNPKQSVTDALLGQQLNIKMMSAAGARADLGQTLTNRSWDVVYGDVGGTLDGTIHNEFTGGPFDFQAVYEYLPTDPWPVVSISCMD